jgi:hypothetical protein
MFRTACPLQECTAPIQPGTGMRRESLDPLALLKRRLRRCPRAATRPESSPASPSPVAPERSQQAIVLSCTWNSSSSDSQTGASSRDQQAAAIQTLSCAGQPFQTVPPKCPALPCRDRELCGGPPPSELGANETSPGRRQVYQGFNDSGPVRCGLEQ